MPSVRLTGTKPELNAIISRLKDLCNLELIKTSKFYESSKLAKEYRVYIEALVLPMTGNASAAQTAAQTTTAHNHVPSNNGHAAPSNQAPPPSATPGKRKGSETADAPTTAKHPKKEKDKDKDKEKKKEDDSKPSSRKDLTEKKPSEAAPATPAPSSASSEHHHHHHADTTASNNGSAAPPKKVAKPPRGRNSFLIWSSTRRSELASKDHSASLSNISKQLAEEWKTIPPEVKKKYEELADQERQAKAVALSAASQSAPEDPGSSDGETLPFPWGGGKVEKTTS